MLKTILNALLVLGIVVAAFLAAAGLLWWLVPLAFLVPFSYGQALALTGIVMLFGWPAMKN